MVKIEDRGSVPGGAVVDAARAAERLKQLLDTLECTYAEAAKYASAKDPYGRYSASSLAHWKDRGDFIRVQTVERLAGALGAPVSYFVDDSVDECSDWMGEARKAYGRYLVSKIRAKYGLSESSLEQLNQMRQETYQKLAATAEDRGSEQRPMLVDLRELVKVLMTTMDEIARKT